MMKTKDTTPKAKKGTIQRVKQEPAIGGAATIIDNRPATLIQRKRQAGMNTSAAKPTLQRKNKTGLPDNLKSGIENLSGYSMDDVKVHYNSSKPAQLRAHAYAQGTNIHLAAGQEKHLPHEAWHVVQQKQGRVKPTMQLKSKVNINDDAGLEKEADVMGAKANSNKVISKSKYKKTTQLKNVIQRYHKVASSRYEKIGVNNNARGFFIGQEKNNRGSFLNRRGRPNLFDNRNAVLRVSENHKLAIEHVNMRKRQAKFFYAAEQEITKWNNTLLTKGSSISLYPDNRKKIAVFDKYGGRKVLVKVQARKISGNENDELRIDGDCGNVLTAVIGPSEYVEVDEQAVIGKICRIPNVDEDLEDNDRSLVEAYGEKMYTHNNERGNRKLELHMREEKLNKYAVPEVGQGMKISGLNAFTFDEANNAKTYEDRYNNRTFKVKGRFKTYAENENTRQEKEVKYFGNHFGGVVAKDGPDYITLENYVRLEEDGVSNANDPRVYFQMYGPGPNQSWHEQWSAIDHGGIEIFNPLTYVLEETADTNSFDSIADRNFSNDEEFINYDFRNKINDDLTDDEVIIILLRGLAYANQFEDGSQIKNSTIKNWLALISPIKDRNGKIEVLKNHVMESLNRKKFKLSKFAENKYKGLKMKRTRKRKIRSDIGDPEDTVEI